MAITEFYLDVELGTGLNDGTSEANAWQTWAAAVTGWTTNSSRLNVKNPTSRFDVSAKATFVLASAGLLSSVIRGYDTTIGDGISAQMENLTLEWNVANGGGGRIEGIDILNADPATAGNHVFRGTNVGSCCFYNCKGVRTAGAFTNPSVFSLLSGGEIVNCYAEVEYTSVTSTGNGILHAQDSVIAYNIVKAKCPTGDWGTAEPITLVSSNCGSEDGAACHRNLIYCDPAIKYGPMTVGIAAKGKGASASGSTSAAGSHYIGYNTVVNCAFGVDFTDMGANTSANTDCVTNNLIAGCPVSFFSRQDGNAQMPMCTVACGNAFDGIIAGALVPVLNRRFSVDPFTDSANEDFSLNSTIGGGLVARASALTATGSFPDIGAIQS
jgi:hypothetical protein